jgi:WhiB family redox-sensing transcriptional regulator
MGHFNIDEFNNYIDLDEEQWKRDANCMGTDVDNWFIEKGEDYDTTILKRICAVCPVAAECLNYAVKYKMQGYWAGTTGLDRKNLRRIQ